MKPPIQTFRSFHIPSGCGEGFEAGMKKLAAGLGLFFLMALFSTNGWAQEREYSGVVSSQDGMPLPGVNVLIKGTTTGTQTDMDGHYSLRASSGQELVFSFLGFTTQTITLSDQAEINLVLEEDVSSLTEVVVTGYSTQKRSTMATSVSKLDTKVLESAPRSNAATALQGTIAGLRVTQTTGQPGSTPSISLRGGTDFDGAGSPLVLIDGVPGSFYALNSDDIASMEVLKDAASTAIYGARAANGVILVTTKRGTAGRTNITYRHRYTVNERRETQNYMGAEDFIRATRLGIRNTQRVMGPNAFNNFLTGPQAMGTGNNATDSPFTTMVLSDSNRHLLDYEGWQTMPAAGSEHHPDFSGKLYE